MLTNIPSNINLYIAKKLEKLSEESEEKDGFVPESTLWRSICDDFDLSDINLKHRLYQKYLMMLHTSKSSLTIYESRFDKEKMEICWRLKVSTDSVLLMASQTDDIGNISLEHNSKRAEDLRKEVRKLRNEVSQLEQENIGWKSNVNYLKMITPQQVQQGFTEFERNSRQIEGIGSVLKDFENTILNIGEMLPIRNN